MSCKFRKDWLGKKGEGRPLHACVNSTNYFYIIVFYTVNSLLQQHTQKHVTYGK